jgi:sulfur carrier protein ThiS
MHIEVALFSRFRDHLPRQARGKATIELPNDATVEHLLTHLGITGRVKLVTINGQTETDRTRILTDGDQVRIFPVVVGG